MPPRPVLLGRLGLAAILALAAWLRLWQLGQNGFGRQYYAAGVRSMLGSWHNFFYNAFDPAGFVSLDKPPVAIWLQVAGAKLLGFSAFGVMLPQVLMGLAAVALVHHLVARRFGRMAGLLAALFLALTPISVAADRSNNTESCLILVLLLAAWALLRAAETGRLALLVLAFALVGVGFNVKMAAALVLAPTLGLVYLCSAPGLSLRRRLLHLAAASAVLVVVALSWVTAFDLTPADERPYAGSTSHNSMLELALVHNGLNRFRSAAPAAPEPAVTPSRPALWDRTPVGPLRMFTPHLAGQMGWWLPLALAGAVLGAAGWRQRRRLSPPQADVLWWSGWALSYGAAFSVAGGVFHTYYVAVLAPPLAALAGIGAAALWWRRSDASMRWALPAVLLAMAAWHGYIDQGGGWTAGGWRGALLALAVAGPALAAAALMLPAMRPVQARAAGLLAMVALLAMPLAWALSTVLVRPNVVAPAADIAALSSAPADEGAARPRSRKLLDFLRANRDSERFLLAVPNALQAAPWIVATGEPVMAMGGYLGRDPILTPVALARMVRDGELRYAIVGGMSLVAPGANERALADWIRAHGRLVSPVTRLYDLRPDLADLWPARAVQ